MADYVTSEGAEKGSLNSRGLVRVFYLIVFQILAMDDGTFPALLKTLSDSSEEVGQEL